MMLTFGKYKGELLSEVDDSYLLWLIDIQDDEILLAACRKEMQERGYENHEDLIRGVIYKDKQGKL